MMINIDKKLSAKLAKYRRVYHGCCDTKKLVIVELSWHWYECA